VVLIILLLAHFWVHHFFIKDFYGQMNIVDLQTQKPSVTQMLNEMNPLWGKHKDTYLAPVRTELEGTPAYLTKKTIKGQGPQTITIVEEKNSTQILNGRLDKSQVQTFIGPLTDSVKISHKTITPSQLKTQVMINHSDVQARVSNIWWKTYNLLFLILAIYHGLTGMWDLLKDYNFSPLVRLSLYGSIVTIGLMLLVIGMLIIVPMGL
jgi:succinate dehydrogenase hydrophobic anchor subunit